ncbi:survival protein sure-like phosphatase/nucleotidase [Dendrothele bispora CBS 962.96]|uniref:Survival protein sure-like phosphatase/nucleotidase n=1 Tax=Dendrothele bispora (strain CBS 962.96) TaxID=1314807 RepID=A0A4S8MIV1_DENBC|nr:survival protein sure-like phosphatase/nucleotidase [Dendrothele bispora CBS 962.96]
MYMSTFFRSLSAFSSVALIVSAKRVVLSNDDGWAVAMIRAQYEALTEDHDVILSCPAINLSGTGSLSFPPVRTLYPCEFNTCPIFSPAEGFNVSDPYINYVNGFPVDAVRYGMKTLAPKFFEGSAPDFVVSGPNVGNNLAFLKTSGTVGAACEASLQGIPSVAISGSGDSLSQVSYTTLESEPFSRNTMASRIYAALTVKFLNILLSYADPILPPGISLNVNYPSIKGCYSVSSFNFILSRVTPDASAVDVETCRKRSLPAEADVVAKHGCFVSVSVFNASTKADVDASTQKVVLDKLAGLLTCL